MCCLPSFVAASACWLLFIASCFWLLFLVRYLNEAIHVLVFVLAASCLLSVVACLLFACCLFVVCLLFVLCCLLLFLLLLVVGWLEGALPSLKAHWIV